MKYFEKLAKKDKEEMGVGELAARTLPGAVVPFLGSYLATPEKMRKAHPVASTLLGPTGAMGAKAKNTGKSQLGTAAGAGAVYSAAAMPALHGLRGGYGGAKGMKLLKGVASMGSMGAVGGALGGAMSYGLGHMFGSERKKSAYK